MREVSQKEAIHDLGNEIIIRAAKDYRAALQKAQKAKSYQTKRDARNTIAEIEIFIRSTWFGTLTDADPEELIKRLREGIG